MDINSEEKTNQKDWICDSCSKELELLDIKDGAISVIQTGGRSTKLHLGIICKECFKIECNICKGTPSNGPCKWCGGEVTPTYDDFFVRLSELQIQDDIASFNTFCKVTAQEHIQDSVFIAGSGVWRKGKWFGNLFVTKSFLLFEYYPFHKKLIPETLRTLKWREHLIEQIKNKHAFIINMNKVIKMELGKSTVIITYKDILNEQNVIKFSSIDDPVIKLLKAYSIGEMCFDSQKYEEFRIGMDLISPEIFLELVLRKQLDPVDAIVSKKISGNALYMETFKMIFSQLDDITQRQRLNFWLYLATKYPESFKSEANNYAKEYGILKALLLSIIVAIIPAICFLLAFKVEHKTILIIIGCFFTLVTFYSISEFFEVVSSIKLRKQLRKLN